jgi:inosose dehydratase
MSRELTRRNFLLALGVAGVARRVTPQSSIRNPQSAVRVGYAAITWGGDDERAIDEIAEVGYKGIQLRNSAVDRWSASPAALRDLLAQKHLTLAVLSSGNLRIDPALEQQELATHVAHAKFVRDVGGSLLQVIDERPKGRAIVAADYVRLGTLMTELGKRTADIGVPLVYHHHMNSLGEKPHEIDAVLDAADPRHVGVLFDIAHYQQGGGDPVAAIRRYRDRIRVVHLKDVRNVDAAPGYQWVELGRGRVGVKACVAALKEIGFTGWAIIELDKVPDAGGSPKGSAILNKEYAERQLGLAL